MNASRYRMLMTAVFACVLALPALAQATMIDYTTFGNFNGTSFSSAGLVAIAENGGRLHINASGLGVAGGVSDVDIDTSESVLFAFLGAGGVNVKFGTSGAFRGPSTPTDTPILVEGFDVDGVSLGVVGFPVFDTVGLNTPIDLSGAFGNATLTSFRIAGSGAKSGVSLWQIAYTDAPPAAPVPEPATLVLCATGLVLAGWRKSRVRRG